MNHDFTRVQDYLHALKIDAKRDDLRVTATGAVVGRFSNYDVKSVFQPIVNAADGATTSVRSRCTFPASVASKSAYPSNCSGVRQSSSLVGIRVLPITRLLPDYRGGLNIVADTG